MDAFELWKVNLSYVHSFGIYFYHGSSRYVELVDVIDHVANMLELVAYRTDGRHIWIKLHNWVRVFLEYSFNNTKLPFIYQTQKLILRHRDLLLQPNNPNVLEIVPIIVQLNHNSPTHYELTILRSGYALHLIVSIKQPWNEYLIRYDQELSGLILICYLQLILYHFRNWVLLNSFLSLRHLYNLYLCHLVLFIVHNVLEILYFSIMC